MHIVETNKLGVKIIYNRLQKIVVSKIMKIVAIIIERIIFIHQVNLWYKCDILQKYAPLIIMQLDLFSEDILVWEAPETEPKTRTLEAGSFLGVNIREHLHLLLSPEFLRVVFKGTNCFFVFSLLFIMLE